MSGSCDRGIVKFTSGHTAPSFWRMSRSAHGRTHVMEYKGVEYSVVQLLEGSGWRYEIRFADGKRKSGVTPVSRAVAIKQAKREIDRTLKDSE
jgi:hypothetical protein